jgi:hypothetical protein
LIAPKATSSVAKKSFFDFIKLLLIFCEKNDLIIIL